MSTIFIRYPSHERHATFAPTAVILLLATLTPVSVIDHGDVVHPRRAPVLQPHGDVHLDVGLDHGAAAAGHLNTDNELHCAGLLTARI